MTPQVENGVKARMVNGKSHCSLDRPKRVNIADSERFISQIIQNNPDSIDFTKPDTAVSSGYVANSNSACGGCRVLKAQMEGFKPQLKASDTQVKVANAPSRKQQTMIDTQRRENVNLQAMNATQRIFVELDEQ